MNTTATKSGYVAIVGRPNVGKSTLLNHLLGKKVSITSRKPQTTRHQILGIKTFDDVQIVYVDTPGLHVQQKSELNRYMNRVAKASMHGVNVVLFVIEALRFDAQDERVLKMLEALDIPVILVVNKVDLIKDQSQLLPFFETMGEKFQFAHIIPISAKLGDHLDVLEQRIVEVLPPDAHYFPPEQFTNRNDRFVASEFIREKLMRSLGQELPYAITVTIDALEEEQDILRMAATIWVERDTQKSIVIGKGGDVLKKVGRSARIDMERFFDKKVFVKLWVKVKSGWSDDADQMLKFGYDDEL